MLSVAACRRVSRGRSVGNLLQRRGEAKVMVQTKLYVAALCSALVGMSRARFTAEEYESGAAHAHIMGIKMVWSRLVRLERMW